VEEATTSIQEKEGSPDQAQSGQPHCNDEEALGARQNIQRAPQTKEAEGNKQG
jgi:hypothetical protein